MLPWLLLLQGEAQFSVFPRIWRNSAARLSHNGMTVLFWEQEVLISSFSRHFCAMPCAMPQGAKQQKDKTSAVLLPGFVTWGTETLPTSMQRMLFLKPLICKIFLQPLRLAHSCHKSKLRYLFDNGLLVNYDTGKLVSYKLILDPSKKTSWANNSLSQSLSLPTDASLQCSFLDPSWFTPSSSITASQQILLVLSIPSQWHPSQFWVYVSHCRISLHAKPCTHTKKK